MTEYFESSRQFDAGGVILAEPTTSQVSDNQGRGANRLPELKESWVAFADANAKRPLDDVTAELDRLAKSAPHPWTTPRPVRRRRTRS